MKWCLVCLLMVFGLGEWCVPAGTERDGPQSHSVASISPAARLNLLASTGGAIQSPDEGPKI